MLCYFASQQYFFILLYYMKIAVVGATGLVGGAMLKILEEHRFPVTEIIPVASEKSVGKTVLFKGIRYQIITAEAAMAKSPDLALFSAGGSISHALAPGFAETGCRVIDNSSAWRMHPEIKLVVPEVNGNVLTASDMIIANPNCSTIQMVMALHPLHRRYRIKRIVVSTYQAVSGTGQRGVEELMNQRNGGVGIGAYPHKIDLNVIPHIDSFTANGYTKEEMKMVQETCKIMDDDNVKVTATTVRVPVLTGHSESVNIEFQRDFDESEVKELLSNSPGVIVIDNPSMNGYPMPVDCVGRDEVLVGRIRRDYSQPNTLNCWIVGDNLRKGAATNAVQIAKLLYNKGFIK